MPQIGLPFSLTNRNWNTAMQGGYAEKMLAGPGDYQQPLTRLKAQKFACD
jgi:hypothetical protein